MATRRSLDMRWYDLKRRHPDLLERIAATGSVRLTLTDLGAADLAAHASDRRDVQRALATRELALRSKFEGGDKAAETLLRRDFGWRDPPAQSVAEVFGEILAEFAAIDPPGYARLHALLERRDSSAAERRRKHAAAAPGTPGGGA
jgi:hypothetical protein